MAIITYVNYVGVKESMRFQVYLTVVFLIIVVCVIVLGFSKSELKIFNPILLQTHLLELSEVSLVCLQLFHFG
ncbi:MAG: hypothetical protein HC811_04770 [Flammeovirgaceae bacterium]|nr:hypothetical protein [Flammeovirgaceae bacterium]